MKLPLVRSLSMPSLAWLKPSNWPTALKWSVGILALVLAIGFGAYTVVFLFLLGTVLTSIVVQFWPLMLGVVVVSTALGAAIGRKSERGMLRGASHGGLYAFVAVVLVPLIVAIFTLINWHP